MADLSKLKLPDNSEYNLKDATARDGLANKQDTLVSGTNIKTINNESLLGSGNITIQGSGDSLPDQTGHNGDILSTDGTDPYWMDVSEATSIAIDTTVTPDSSNLITSGAVSTAISNVDALPSQSGQSGKYLTTNGTSASWAAVSTEPEVFWATYGTTTNAQIEEAYQAGKEIVMNYDGRVYQLVSRASSSSHTFGCVYYNTYYQAGCALGSWTNTSTSLSLPSQSGHSGDFLTTNGTAASWADPVTTSTLTIDSTPTANSTNLVTSGGTRAAISELAGVTASWFNRANAVTGADTNYTSLITRGEKLLDKSTYDAVTNWSSQLVNGAIAWCYE